MYVYMLRCFSCIQLFVTLWTADYQDPLSMGFSRQEYWNGLPFHCMWNEITQLDNNEAYLHGCMKQSPR